MTRGKYKTLQERVRKRWGVGGLPGGSASWTGALMIANATTM